MTKKSFPDVVRSVTFPLCVFSCLGMMVCGVSGIWLALQPVGEVLWALAGSFAITAFASAMALGAAAAMKNSQ